MTRIGLSVMMLTACTLSAVQLPFKIYDLDFSEPETGIYQVLYGSPSIAASAGPFTNALVFDSLTNAQTIQLLLDVPSPRIEIEYDVLVHGVVNSEYAFSAILDGREPRTDATVRIHGLGDRFRVFQDAPYTVAPLGTYTNDRVYHFEISVNLDAALWTLRIDGAPAFENPVVFSGLKAIYFDMRPWISGASNAPGVYAALDNIVVTVVPEPATFTLLGVGSLAPLVARSRR